MPHLLRDGQRVAYDALGSGPETVLLAHNLMARRGSFAEVAARLAPRCRVLAVDLRGHGESTPSSRRFCVEDLADDLVAVLDAEGAARAVLVGTSLGATAAALVALRRPERVRGLVLMSATPHAATRRDRLLRFGPLAAVVGAIGPGLVMRAIVGELLGASYRAREGTSAAASAIRATPRGDLARSIRAWAGRPALLERLPGVTAPTRVVAGAEDTACPLRFAEAIAAAIPGATLTVVPGAGHTLQLERPAAVAAAIETLLGELAGA
jgi:pimeloyl-ACP methyl ester carboxylesterase